MKHRPVLSALGVSLALAALVVASRLPQFLGGRLYPDGDECIVGLMGLRWLKHGEAPLLFWGQAYGLVTIEAGAAALGYRLAGFGPLALKGAMLGLWVLGLIPLGLAMRRFAGGRAAWLTVALLALCPAWFSWSMKARGGYLTGFLITNTIIWLAARLAVPAAAAAPAEPPGPSGRGTGEWLHLLGLGALGGLAYWAQPVWMPAAGAFMLLGIGATRRRPRALGLAVVGGVAVWGALWLATRGRLITWEIKALDNINALVALAEMPRRLWIHLSGYYIMKHPVAAPFWTAAAACLWCAGLAAFRRPLWRWRRERTFTYERAALLGLGGTLALTLNMTVIEFGFRYLLPVSGLLAMVLGGRLARATSHRLDGGLGRMQRPAAWAAAALMLAVGARAAIEWRTPPGAVFRNRGDLPPATAIRALTARLLDLGVHHAYSTDALLQWAVTFDSEERIVARSFFVPDRFPPYLEQVEAARRAGKPLAIVGVYAELPAAQAAAQAAGLPPPDPIVIDDTYFILTDPPDELLKLLHFNLYLPWQGL